MINENEIIITDKDGEEVGSEERRVGKECLR